MDEVARLSQGKYLSLTTFRKNGEPVATPVWVAREGEHLYVTTRADSWKVKRLRNNSEVLLAPCDVKGKITGPQVAGSGELLDDADSDHVRTLIRSKYGLVARAMFLWESLGAKFGREPADSIGIRLTPSSGGGNGSAGTERR